MSPYCTDHTVVAAEIGSNHFGPRLRFLGVMCGVLITQPVWHTHTAFSVTEASGTVGLFVHTQVIIPDFICRNCTIGIFLFFPQSCSRGPGTVL